MSIFSMKQNKDLTFFIKLLMFIVNFWVKFGDFGVALGFCCSAKCH